MDQRLKDWAKEHNLTYGGALKAYHRGDIPGAYQLPSKTILIKQETTTPPEKHTIKAALYSRVSTRDQITSLHNQTTKLEAYATAKGYQIIRSEQEIASGLNDNRKKLSSLMNDLSWDILLVENKDRLARFGVTWLQQWALTTNREIIITNTTTLGDEETLTTDLINIITTFCGRIYGKRDGNKKANQITQPLTNNDNNE